MDVLRNEYLVSVCVPIYKVEKYIERCARSLFEQTYENIEYVFVNDCSPDNSIAILAQIAELYPHRKSQMRIIRHETNCGLGKARNTGIREAKGEFILHVDSDDYIDTITIEKLVAKQQETDADIVKYPKKLLYTTKVQIEKLHDYLSPRELLEEILIGKIAGNVCGTMIRTSLYRDNDIQVEYGVNQSEDFQVMPRLLYFAKCITFVDNVFYFYDLTNVGSYTNNKTEKSYYQINKSLKVLESFFIEKSEKQLYSQLWLGQLASRCRDKVVLCKLGNKEMFKHVCSLIEQIIPKVTHNVPLKYRMMANCKSYYLFKAFTILK